MEKIHFILRISLFKHIWWTMECIKTITALKSHFLWIFLKLELFYKLISDDLLKNNRQCTHKQSRSMQISLFFDIFTNILTNKMTTLFDEYRSLRRTVKFLWYLKYFKEVYPLISRAVNLLAVCEIFFDFALG